MKFAGFDHVTWEMKWKYQKVAYPFSDGWGNIVRANPRYLEVSVPLGLALDSPTWEAYANRIKDQMRQGSEPEGWDELEERARRQALYFPSREDPFQLLPCIEEYPSPLRALGTLSIVKERLPHRHATKIIWVAQIKLFRGAPYFSYASTIDDLHLVPSAIDPIAAEGRNALCAIADAYCWKLEDGSHAGNIRWKQAMVMQILGVLLDEYERKNGMQECRAVRCHSPAPETFESLRAQGKTLGEINQIFADRGDREIMEGEGLLHLPTKSHQICWDSPRKWTEIQVLEAKASLAKSGLIGRFITEGEMHGKTTSDQI